MKIHRRGGPAIVAAAVATLGALGCGSSSSSPTGEVNEYLLDLPTWAEFSPPRPTLEAAPTGEAQSLPDETMDVSVVEPDGSITLVPDATYRCSQTPYSVQDTPEKIVMYSPDLEILWPGSLLQGKSHRDGLGSLLGLTIAERTPLRVSIPALPSGENFREVADPGQATVSGAIGQMIGDATLSGLPTPSSITFDMRTFTSEQEFALSLGISGNYLGFSASASGDFSRSSSETTVTAHFVQKMYEVVIEPPQTPGAFFSDAFTQAKLQEQIDLGRIGPDNIPVYVSNVVYGRMMTFAFTSTASEQEIRATLEAAYESVAGGVSVELSAQQRKILSEAKIAVTSLGGDAQATLALIRSGSWQDYFTADAALSSAAPISYTFRNLGDGSIASVTETSTYNVKECQAVASSPGRLSFKELQSQALGLPTPVHTLQADVNGDGRGDLIWNSLGATNQFRIGYGNSSGSFDISPVYTHPETPGTGAGWSIFRPIVGRFDDDARWDLAWTHLSNAHGNRTYFASISDPSDEGLRFLDTYPVNVIAGGWDTYAPIISKAFLLGNKTHFIFNSLASENRWYVGYVQDDHVINTNVSVAFAGGGWGTYKLHSADLSGDTQEDLLWRAGRRFYYAQRIDTAATYLQSTAQDHPRDTSTYTFFLADVSGDGRAEAIWADTSLAGVNNVEVATFSTATASLSTPTYLAAQPASLGSTVDLKVSSGDVNGDGRADLIWTTTGATNRVYVSLGRGDATFDFSPANQLHPETSVDWAQFELRVFDVDGDGLDDLVWNHAATTNRIYVALALAPG